MGQIPTSAIPAANTGVFITMSLIIPLATLLIEEVLALCDRLPPRTARIFRMSRIDGLTNREIAERLHIAQRTVEKHISLSIRWFRRSPQFKDRWPDSE